MPTKTEDEKALVLEQLLSDARREADSLRGTLERYERIIASTRLIMGHELKKPSTAISGYLDLVAEDLEKDGSLEVLNWVEKARSECRLLNELNAFYVELLKVDGEGADTVGVPTIEVESLIREIIDGFPGKLDAKNRVNVWVDGDVKPVSFNRDALKLIVMNLIENALIYSQVRTPVRIEVEESTEKRGMRGGRLVKIRVSDDGVGIPESYLKRIFSPFVRLREDIAEGSGLGLTLVRSLVELFGGEVYVRSGDVAGTTVHVTLPITDKQGDDPVVLL
jgi:two-component system phosphate regulon sensor histidine kinase PhoR